MPLHPKIRAGLERLNGLPRMNQLSPAEAREQMRTLTLAIAAKAPAPELGAIEDRSIADGSLCARVYTPVGAGPFPLVHFFHGGGFVVGDLETYDYLCRTLCAGAGAVILAPDYRLAPEHPYPCAVVDCLAAIDWAQRASASLRVDANRVAVAGDSAGGNLAAVCALRRRGVRPGLRAQLLIYPVTDHCSSAHSSYKVYGDGYGLTSGEMGWFWDHYLREPGTAADEAASPLRSRDLSGLPPSLIIGAEFDVLRDEGRLYGERLRESGVPTEYRLAEGMNHGFWLLAPALAEARQSIRRACEWLAAALQPGD